MSRRALAAALVALALVLGACDPTGPTGPTGPTDRPVCRYADGRATCEGDP